MSQPSAPARPRTRTALPMIWWDRFRLWLYTGSDREGVGQVLYDRQDIQALCDRRDQLEEQLRTTSYQAENQGMEIRFWRWTAYEMAELARQAVAKYGSAKSPPASPLLDTHHIMEMYERQAQGTFAAWSTPQLPGEPLLAYRDRLLAAMSPAFQIEAIQRTTARRYRFLHILSAALANLPHTTDEMDFQVRLE
jgi:hypothetical protein